MCVHEYMRECFVFVFLSQNYTEKREKRTINFLFAFTRKNAVIALNFKIAHTMRTHKLPPNYDLPISKWWPKLRHCCIVNFLFKAFLLLLQPIVAICHMTIEDIITCEDYPEEHVALITLANRQHVWEEVYSETVSFPKML